MNNVVDLAEAQAARRERRLPALDLPDHPALRWVAGRVFYVAHRKIDGAASCGAAGDLVLAPPGVPLCVECYPRAGEVAQ